MPKKCSKIKIKKTLPNTNKVSFARERKWFNWVKILFFILKLVIQIIQTLFSTLSLIYLVYLVLKLSDFKPVSNFEITCFNLNQRLKRRRRRENACFLILSHFRQLDPCWRNAVTSKITFCKETGILLFMFLWFPTCLRDPSSTFPWLWYIPFKIHGRYDKKLTDVVYNTVNDLHMINQYFA